MLGATLALLVRAPERQDGLHAARGHRVLRIAPHAVRALEVTLGDRRFAARRTAGGWEIDGQPASPRTAEALGDLVVTLARLRAIDVFRPRDAASYGLDHPRGTIVVDMARDQRRLVLGSPNAAASALYARRDGDPRVIQVGIMLLSEIERVFFTRAETVSRLGSGRERVTSGGLGERRAAAGKAGAAERGGGQIGLCDAAEASLPVTSSAGYWPEIG